MFSYVCLCASIWVSVAEYLYLLDRWRPRICIWASRGGTQWEARSVLFFGILPKMQLQMQLTEWWGQQGVCWMLVRGKNQNNVNIQKENEVKEARRRARQVLKMRVWVVQLWQILQSKWYRFCYLHSKDSFGASFFLHMHTPLANQSEQIQRNLKLNRNFLWHPNGQT